MRLTYKQRMALGLIALHADGSAYVTHDATGHDAYNAWINGATAQSLERRGLVVIDRDIEGWTVYPAPIGVGG